jgi:ATP-binding cassette, subfamily B, bacterial MsbA
MEIFLRRLWKFVRPYRLRLFLGLLFGILCALTNGLVVLIIQFVARTIMPDTESNDHVQKQLHRLPEFVQHWVTVLQAHLQALLPTSTTGKVLTILCIPVVMLIRAIFGYLNLYLMTWSAVRAVAALRTALFDHLQNMSLDFFSRARTGDLMSRINSDTQSIQIIIGNSLASVVRDPIQIILLVALLLIQDPALTLLSVVVMPICVVPIIVYGRKVRKSAKAAQTYSAELATLMHESFTGSRIVKAYNLEATVLAQFKTITGNYVGQVLRILRANEIPSQAMEVLGATGVALIMLYLVLSRNGAGPVDFVGFVMSLLLIYPCVKSLVRLHNQMHQAAAASERVFQLLETPNTILDPVSPVPLHAASADIHFENIEFAYGERPVLRGINLDVKAGQMVALVGASGAGKTTLTNLLLRFYDPKSGVIRIGPTNIRDVALKDLRRQIALVAQETILFNDTVRANIAVGRPGATNEEIEAAAKHAFAHDFIMEKPLGYETTVGEKGATVSGGQRQRISIARALLRNAPILVFDEATNQLDTESERVVQAALDQLMKGRTTICIAHRLSTIQNADVIVVLDQGCIVETGTHAELIRRGGIYQKLYELQFRV